MSCPVCRHAGVKPIALKNAVFFRCPECFFVYRAPDQRLSAEKERERYLLHHNSLENAGYVAYLTAIIDNTLALMDKKPVKVLDWGSGPAPVTVSLLEKRGYACASWDPVFNTASYPAAGAYDLVFCIEVAEHFAHPAEEFARLASFVAPGGTLLVHTHFAPPEDSAFRVWWYKEDPTHVSFYTSGALARLGTQSGLIPLAFTDDKAALFRKAP